MLYCCRAAVPHTATCCMKRFSHLDAMVFASRRFLRRRSRPIALLICSLLVYVMVRDSYGGDTIIEGRSLSQQHRLRSPAPPLVDVIAPPPVDVTAPPLVDVIAPPPVDVTAPPLVDVPAPPLVNVPAVASVPPVAVVKKLPQIKQLSQIRNHKVNESEYYRRQPTKVNVFRHNFLINANNLCKETPYMMILVHSAPHYWKKREAIRSTWGLAARQGSWPPNQRLKFTVKLAFLLAFTENSTTTAAINLESRTHSDIIQGDFVDAYRNMTLKSLLGLKWVIEYCPGIDILLKSDDDMIVNLPHLYNILKNKRLKRSVIGPLNLSSIVLRYGKWSLPDFPFKRYPPYESGAAYAITSDVIVELFNTSEYVPPIFIDDVYITGILGRIIGINHVRQPGFGNAATRVPSACDLINNRVITGSMVTPGKLTKVWREMTTTKCH